MKNLCILPVKEHSIRLPGKNTKDFFGKPLFVHSLIHARESGLFNKIHVATSSNKISKITAEADHEIDFLNPESLSQDAATLFQVCEFVINAYEERGEVFDNFCLLWATSPMRKTEDIQNAYKLFQDKSAEAVVGVCEYNLPVQCAQELTEEGLLSPVFAKQDFWGKSEKKIVCDNGSLCWVNIEAFKKHKTWLPPQTYGYKMPLARSIDLDTQDDWDMLEYFYRKYNAKT